MLLTKDFLQIDYCYLFETQTKDNCTRKLKLSLVINYTDFITYFKIIVIVQVYIYDLENFILCIYLKYSTWLILLNKFIIITINKFIKYLIQIFKFQIRLEWILPFSLLSQLKSYKIWMSCYCTKPFIQYLIILLNLLEYVAAF